MECNKDEACRAKEIAERKFLAKDIAGAKKFALKAQNLYPGLDGITHMLATLDVYISVDNKVNGETDWYGILGVNPQADDEVVRKKYRKLALMLHPDKNKSIGGEGAFKFISEAWSILSDKTKRMQYDNINGRTFTRVPTPSGTRNTTTTTTATSTTNAPSHSNGTTYNVPKTTTSNAKSHKKTSRETKSSAPPPPPPPRKPPKSDTFWTVCHGCKMQYEYLRVYLNQNLLCPTCHQPFPAVETAPPPSSSSKPPVAWSFTQHTERSNQTDSKSTNHQGKNNVGSKNVGAGGFHSSNSYSQSNFQWGPFSGNSSASTAAQAATVGQPAYDKVRREREEAQTAIKREEALRRKQASKRMSGNSSTINFNPAKKIRGMDAVGASGYGRDAANQMGLGTVGAGSGNISGFKQGSFETVRVLSLFESQSLLVKKAKKEVEKKLSEWNSASGVKTSVKYEDRGNQKVNKKEEKPLGDGDVCDKYNAGESADANNIISLDAGNNVEILEQMSINVPDPDFHDFDKDRTEKSFEANQVWSAYDNENGMPRYYAMIHNVISLNPFKIRISWLNSKTNSELGPISWVSSGFSKTCGDFRIGKHETNNSLNSFSHKIRWVKGPRGLVSIYPRKGDVWATYRNWSPDWNELTPDKVIHKYDMVEVLEDYSEELGVTVAPLVKVAGFQTVFHRHLDPREVGRVPREEMFRFSHHVPSYLLTGQEGLNAPTGCRELDPAATPVELLQVVGDVKYQEIIIEEEKTKEADMEAKRPGDVATVEKFEKAKDEKENSKDAIEIEEEEEEEEPMEDAEENPVS